MDGNKAIMLLKKWRRLLEKTIISCITSTMAAVKGGTVNFTGKSWSKCYGDTCARIFSEFIMSDPKIKPYYDVSHVNAYIEGIPTEYDLLLLQKGAVPIKYTNCFKAEDVKAVIEFKANGLYGGKVDLVNVINKVKVNFDLAHQKNANINCAYLTLQEVTHCKKLTSINYFCETQNTLKPYEAFCFRDSRDHTKIRIGEWAKFIYEISK